MKYIHNIIRILDPLPLVYRLLIADQQYMVILPVSHDICLHNGRKIAICPWPGIDPTTECKHLTLTHINLATDGEKTLYYKSPILPYDVCFFGHTPSPTPHT